MRKSDKITYLGLCLFAALLFGCDKDPVTVEVEEPTPPKAELQQVGFQVDCEMTKGVVTTHKDSILSLGIIGYSTGTADYNGTTAPNLFDNVAVERTFDEVTKTLSAWSYDPITYWPSNPEIKNTFFAYSPYQDEFPEGSIEIVAEEDAYPQIIYSVPEAMSEQVDLLYSEFDEDVKNINYAKNNGQVKYNMKHSLLWLRFMLAPVKENETPATGKTETYTVTEFNMTADRIINTGRFDLSTGKWNLIEDLPDSDGGYEGVDYEFDNLWDEPLTVTAGETFPMGGTSFTNCLMIIPQNIVLSDNATAVSVAFTHDDASGAPTNTEHYITMPFPDVKLDKAGYVMTFIVKLSIKGSWIEFQDSNPIEAWLEDDEPREIETF